MSQAEAAQPNLQTNKRSRHRLLRILRRYRKRLFFVYFLYFLNAVLNLLPGYSVSVIVDLIAGGKQPSFLGMKLPMKPAANVDEAWDMALYIFLVMLGVILVANTIGVVMWRTGTRVVEDIILRLKLRIHDQINNLSLRYFSGERTGRIMTKALSDVNNFSQTLRQSYTLSYVGVQFLLSPVLMITLSPWLFLLTILPLPIVALALYHVRFKLRPLYLKQRETESSINAQLQESITGIREIKAFNMRDTTSQQYRSVNDEFYHRQNAIMRIFSFNHQLQYGTKDFALVLTVIGGSVMAYTGFGSVTIGEVLSFVVLQQFFYGPIGHFFGFYDLIQRGIVSWTRIDEFLSESPEVKDSADAHVFDPPVLKRDIVFDKVNFTYSKETRTLHDISFAVKHGEKVAIVGPSGSGKSTIISVLLRFYDIQSGAIRFDGVDIREYTQESLRKCIGIVFQETFLFYGTVYSNLSYVNRRKSNEEIIDACRQANIHDDIMRLPQGYDTMVGERGATLSGGQRQRLGIARALLRDPSVIVLDEATSAVDTVTEKLIQQSLESVLEGRTAFIIAHRLSTIRKCDKIIVLDAGRIIQMGTHRELVNQPGKYQSLHQESEV